MRSFGPNALNVMLSTASGKLMMTSAGMTILQALNISHPIGQMLISSIHSHYKMTGDNSKTLLLFVCEMLKRIEKSVLKNEKFHRMKYCKVINQIRNEALPRRILPDVIAVCRTILTSKNVRKQLSSLVSTYLQGKMNHGTREHFTQLLTDYVFSASENSAAKLANALQHITDNFTCLFHENPGFSQFSTTVVPGIIITREFMRNWPRTVDTNCLQFVLMGCSMERKDSEICRNTVFSGLQKENLRKALLWKRQFVLQQVTNLASTNVKIVLTAAHVSEMVLHSLSTHGIAVAHCVDEEELDFVSQQSGVPIIFEPEDVASGDISQHLGCLDSCEAVVVAGRRCIQMVNVRATSQQGGPNSSQAQLGNIQSVLVCAPTPGMCSQFKSVLYNALKCLHMWLDPDNILKPCTKQEDQDGTVAHSDIVGYSIVGGGAFELLLYRHMKAFAGGSSDADLREVLELVCDSLLSVPVRLIQNSYASPANRMNLAQLVQLTKTPIYPDTEPGEATQHDEPVASEVMDMQQHTVGVDGKTGVGPLSSNSNIVQPLASKVLMLFQALDLLHQLLRIDSNVSVTKIHPQKDSSDDEN